MIQIQVDNTTALTRRLSNLGAFDIKWNSSNRKADTSTAMRKARSHLHFVRAAEEHNVGKQADVDVDVDVDVDNSTSISRRIMIFKFKPQVLIHLSSSL